MAVRIVFLGHLRDLAGGDQRDAPAPLDWASLLASFAPQLATAFSHECVRVALNGELLVDREALIARHGDEVALLPPVSGG